MAVTGSYSRSDLGELTTDGRLIDVNGNEVPIGLDADTKAELQAMIDGPKVRTAPSERDQFFAAGGTIEPKQLESSDVLPGGGIDDLKAQADTSTPTETPTQTESPVQATEQ